MANRPWWALRICHVSGHAADHDGLFARRKKYGRRDGWYFLAGATWILLSIWKAQSL